MWENASIFAFKMCRMVCFLSTRLRSSTYNITGPLVGAEHPILSVKNVWKNFDLYSDISYATVQAHAPADVRCSYVILRHSEDWLPVWFSTIPSIYLNSSWRAGRYMTSIFILLNLLLFPSTGSFLAHFQNFSVLMCTANVAIAVGNFTKRAQSFLNTWGTCWEVYCDTEAGAIATLCTEKDWWCDLCKKTFIQNKNRLCVLLPELKSSDMSELCIWIVYICFGD